MVESFYIVADWKAQYFACAEENAKKILEGCGQGTKMEVGKRIQDFEKHHFFAEDTISESKFFILLADNKILPSDHVPFRVSATLLPLVPSGGVILRGIIGIIEIEEGNHALVLETA